jgi:hypothetical protein
MAITYRVLAKKTEGKRPLGRHGTDGKIIPCILQLQDEIVWTIFNWVRMGVIG